MEPQPGGAPGPAGLGFEAQLARFSIAGEESPSPEPRFPPPPEESRVFKPICTAPLTGTTSSGLTSSTATGEAAAPGSSSPATQDQPAVVHEAEESEPGGAMDQPEANKADDESDDDEAEIVEESPTGRWLKRKEQIKYRDVPGIDTAYLAMDSEEGFEVVWNEAQFSTAKKFSSQEEKLKGVFEALTLIDHPNIVRFHNYWIDKGNPTEKKPPRLVFITEYMSSGSLKNFLRKTKKNNRKIALQSWKRWCTQILSALSYLHQTCSPPIIHGNLTCDTIFIQHNGLVKIGSIAPDIIHQNVKTCRENIKNLHYLAPEWGEEGVIPGTPSDIYAFGVCALETAALDIQPSTPQVTAQPAVAGGSAAHATSAASATSSSGSITASSSQPPASDKVDNLKEAGKTGTAGGSIAPAHDSHPTGGVITEDMLYRAIDHLDDDLQKDFIRKCMNKDPKTRPTARELLFHPVLFEVHSLKLLAAHSLVNAPDVDLTSNINETMDDDATKAHYTSQTVKAVVTKKAETKEYKLADFPVAEKLEKFMEDVKNGIYPITAFPLLQSATAVPKTRACSPESVVDENKRNVGTPEPEKGLDHPKVFNQIFVALGFGDTEGEDPHKFNMVCIGKSDDGIFRQTHVTIDLVTDTPDNLVSELVTHQFFVIDNAATLRATFADAFRKFAILVAQCALGDIPPIQEGEFGEGVLEQRTPDQYRELLRQFRWYNPGHPDQTKREEAKDPEFVISHPDAFNIMLQYPIPEGIEHLTPFHQEPETVEHKEVASHNNAFDYRHVEVDKLYEMIEQNYGFVPHGSSGKDEVAPSFTPQTTDSGPTYTPSQPRAEGQYDALSNLQEAQKALENYEKMEKQQQQGEPNMEKVPQDDSNAM